VVLAELIGITNFHDRVKGLSQDQLGATGGGAFVPDFCTTRNSGACRQATTCGKRGKRIRLKHNVQQFAKALENLAERLQLFRFYVISAAPQEIIQSATRGKSFRRKIFFGTRFPLR